MTTDLNDATGSRIGRIEASGDVYDKNGNYVGRIVEGKTLDKSGSVIAYAELPGLLLKED